MVGQDEGFCFCPGRAFLEEGHAQLAGGQFDRFFLGCGELRSPRLGMLDGKIQAARLADDKAARKASPAAREEFVMRME